MKVAFKAVPQFMSQGHMAGHGACHHGAFGFEDVPNGTGHGGRQIRLLSAHAFGMRAKVRHIIAHLPVDAHLVHDPVVGRHDIEGNKFPARYFVVGCHLASAQSQDQNSQRDKTQQERSRKKTVWDRPMHKNVINFDELYFEINVYQFVLVI